MSDIGKILGSGDGSTFMGLPARAIGDLAGEVAVIGIPSATPYADAGAYSAAGPIAIRRAVARYANARHHHDFDLGGPLLDPAGKPAVDCGDLSFDAQDFALNRRLIADAILSVLDRGSVPVVLGGDDSVPIPVLSAYATAGPLTIVQIDEHIDWRDEVGGERLGLSSTMRRASEMAHVERIVQIGQRGIGSARPGDVADAVSYGVRFVPARTLHRDGVAAALAEVPKGANVFVSFDIDALDPSVAPGVIGRSPGGLSFAQALDLLHGIAARSRIAGAALVEFAEEHDGTGQTALVAGRLAANLIGLASRQR
ncbi:MAG: arginase family protein [Hyphomicrobiales bacterium]|nr:arginase family protein [Hyphomicrobiales bacterium]